MLATKQPTKTTYPPVSVRLEPEDFKQLEAISEKYPLYSRNQMIRAAFRAWAGDAVRYGLDAHLQPLRKGA